MNLTAVRTARQERFLEFVRGAFADLSVHTSPDVPWVCTAVHSLQTSLVATSNFTPRKLPVRDGRQEERGFRLFSAITTLLL